MKVIGDEKEEKSRPDWVFYSQRHRHGRPIDNVLVCKWPARSIIQEDAVYIDDLYRRLGFLCTPYHFVINPYGVVSFGRLLSMVPMVSPDQSEGGRVRTALAIGCIVPMGKPLLSDFQMQSLNELLAMCFKCCAIPPSNIAYIP